jgi:putative flippase GtrA
MVFQELFRSFPLKLRFLLVGGMNTLLGALVIVCLQYLLGAWLPPQVIFVIASLVFSFPAFYAMKHLAFRAKGNHGREYMKYLVTSGLNLLIGVAAIFLLVDFLGFNVYLGQVASIVICIVAVFILHLSFTFKTGGVTASHQGQDNPTTTPLSGQAGDYPLVRLATFGHGEKIYAIMDQALSLSTLGSILVVRKKAGANPVDQGFLEQLYPFKDRVTAWSGLDASESPDPKPTMGKGRTDWPNLPFATGSFDLVFAPAVLERAGSGLTQADFIRECARVASKHLFLTTPNRWHPLEFHSALPFLHWLPKPIHRGLLKFVGYESLASANNLNLLDEQALRKICQRLGLGRPTVYHTRFLGFTANLLLHIRVTRPAAPVGSLKR